jgi:peptide/nickel transport system substrate-binding protein
MADRMQELSRRKFLVASTAAAAGVLSACAAPTPEIVEVTREVEVEKEVEVTREVVTEIEKEVEVTKEVEVIKEVEVPEGYGEAPMLADRVAAGELPPVEERLPVAPEVVSGREAIGVYGGEARQMNQGWNWFTSQYGWFCERMTTYSDIDLRTVLPSIFESWEMSDDGRTFTIHMREGLKWSDGTPCTTEDVEFWWVDFATRDDLGYTSWHWRHGGELAQFEFLDDYTFTITFAAPFGQFAAHMTRWFPGMDSFLYPKHYMKQFHAAYADEAELNALVEAEGYENWQGLFYGKGEWGVGYWMATTDIINVPTLAPWVVVEKDDNVATYVFERNPYYWKVDQVGNQLPYLDTVRIEFAADTTIFTQRIIQGELDYVGPHDVSVARYPLYKENEPGNTYVVADLLSCMIDRYVLFPQHTILNDPVLEEIVRTPNFIQALSVAIDRDEINESLFFGLARTGQLGPMPNSKYYKEAYGRAWAEFDPDLANQLLDEMGLDQRDSEGFRLRPDGQRLTFNIEHAGARVGVVTGEFCEMAVSYWRDIGIDATSREEQENLITERMRNGEVHCTVWHADRCTDLLLPLEMRWYIPLADQQGGPSAKWAQWYNAADRTDPDLIEPPDYIQQLYAWHDEMNVVVDEDERVAIGQKIFDWLAETPLSIGTVLECPSPLIFNKNLRNLPRPRAPMGWDTYGMSTYHPEALFFEGGERAS